MGRGSHGRARTADQRPHPAVNRQHRGVEPLHGAATWMSVMFGDITADEAVHATLDSNGTVHMAYWDTVDDDVIMLRLYSDQDRDGVDLIDAMPTVGNQWKNSGSDAFGDNPLGPLPDACPTMQGFVVRGSGLRRL